MAEEPKQAEKGDPKVKLLRSDTPPEEIYVDGAMGLITRAGVVKIDLYRVAGYERGTNAELRQHSHRLVLPAMAAGELLNVLQSAADAMRRTLQAQPGAKKPS
jgi:hypothetical protein